MRNRGPWTTLEYDGWPGVSVGQTSALTGRATDVFSTLDPLGLAHFLPGRSLHLPEQVHDSTVRYVRSPYDTCYPGADGLLSGRPDELLMIRTADCVPVVLLGDLTGEVGLVHAGWRGLVKGIFPCALEKMHGPVHVFLGAHIRSGRYEVGDDVVDRLEQCFDASEEELMNKGILSPGRHLSLNRALVEQGKQSGEVYSFQGFPQDTSGDNPPMFSHRKNRTEERMLTWAVRRSR